MKLLAIAMWLSVIGSADAQAISSICSTVICRGAPAPSIGAGVPVALVMGGVLLAMRLWKSWRQS
jgi:hypothetical protein